MVYRKVKPQFNEKTSRNLDIVNYAKENPKSTQSEIADKFGISTCRVNTILKHWKRPEEYE